MVQPDENPILSPEEFDERLRVLSKADYIRLQRIAVIYAVGYALDPSDLLSEAVKRALEGSRRCPRQVDVVRFLDQVMRSLCSGENKAQDRKPKHLSLSFLEDEGFDPADPSPTPEQQLQSQQAAKDLWDKICSIFHDDDMAMFIIEGRMVGYEPEEIRNDLGIDKKTYDSKRRLIRRRIDRHLEQEGVA